MGWRQRLAAQTFMLDRQNVRLDPFICCVRWDVVDGGLCGHTEDIAHRLVTVKDGPVLLKLDIGGLGKPFIPIYGLFAQPEYRILVEGEE
jgi:hypothetical protein